MTFLVLNSSQRRKWIWVYRYWMSRSDPLRIPIGETQTLDHALRSLGEAVPNERYWAIISDGSQMPGDELMGKRVRDGAIIRTAVMAFSPGGTVLLCEQTSPQQSNPLGPP